MMRTFIAIELDDDIRQSLGDVQRSVPVLDRAVRWVRPDSIHLTLKFLGDIVPEAVPRVAEAMETACMGIGPFRFQVKGFGCFPGPWNPRVFWAGIEPDGNELKTLQRNIESEMQKIGMKKEKRPFRPHLTLARIRARIGAFPLPEEGGTGGEPDIIGEQDVTRIVLFQSELLPEGAVYVPLATVPLEG
jgi:2'-5' RNA ligase